MRTPPQFWRRLQAAAAAGLMLCVAPGCKPAVKPSVPVKAAGKTNAVKVDGYSTTNPIASVFEQLMAPKGRDPFFPNSHRRDPVPTAASRTDRPPPASELVLKGIVGTTSHHLAVINNAILESGEEGSVRVAGGHIRVRCTEIGQDYAVIKVEGEIQPRRLVLSKKGF